MGKEEQTLQTEETTEAVDDQNGVEAGAETDTKDSTEPSDMQRIIDQRVSDALIKQEKRFQERLEAEEKAKREREEREKLEREGEWQKLHNATQAELDTLRAENAAKEFRIEAQAWLADNGLSQHGSAIMRGVTNMEQLEESAHVFQDAVKTAVGQGVREALDTGPNRTPANTAKVPDKPLDQLSRDEFVEWKSKQGYV